MAQGSAGQPAPQGGSTALRAAAAGVALLIGAASVLGTVKRILSDR